jgi:hypothetical protein
MALLSPEDVAGLEFLLKAPSKTVVVDIFKGAFTHRNDQVPDEVLASVAKTLNIQPLESIKVIITIVIVFISLFCGIVTPISDHIDKESTL